MSDPLLLRPEEAAKMLGIGRSLCYLLMARGELESLHIHRRRLVEREALNRFVKRQREKPAEIGDQDGG